MEKLVQVSNLTKVYGKRNEAQVKALAGLDLTVNSGEFVVIMGASGSGKSTLLNILATLDKPTSGQVLINGQDVTTLKKNKLAQFRGRELGFVFQDFNLLENLTVKENIALPLNLQNQRSKKIDAAVVKIAQQLGIDDLLAKYPAQLSGGQKQRVAAARAMVHQPEILLADEPTGALDSNSTKDLMKLLADLNASGKTLLMVTHDPYSASFGKRIIFIRDGKIASELTRGTYERHVFYERLLEHLGTFDEVK